MYSSKICFEVQKDIAKLLKYALKFLDVEGNSFVLNNMILLDYCEPILKKVLGKIKNGESIHFNAKILKRLFKHKAIHDKYLDIKLITELLDVSQGKRCDIGCES